MSQVALNHFDRSKPFYPLVINYVSQLIGYKELAVLGVIGPRSVDDALAAVTTVGMPTSLSEVDRAAFTKELATAMGPLQLRSEFSNTAITVDIDEIARRRGTSFPRTDLGTRTSASLGSRALASKGLAPSS
jgi:hypothetical protein